MRTSPSALVSPFGFESGWAEFAFQNPPPLLPSILMASWLALGPPGMTWVLCSRVFTTSNP